MTTADVTFTLEGAIKRYLADPRNTRASFADDLGITDDMLSRLETTPLDPTSTGGWGGSGTGLTIHTWAASLLRQHARRFGADGDALVAAINPPMWVDPTEV